MSNSYRLMAIDDDPQVLDAYQSLFPQQESLLGDLWDLVNGAQKQSTLENEDIQFNFQLECYSSGELGVEALRKSMAEESPFAAIFLDMRMPNGWNGLETAIKIRQLDESVRIILVSAYSDYTLQEIRAQIGPRFVFHSKPWIEQELGQLTRLLVSDWGYEQDLQKMQYQLQEATTEVVRANRAKDQFLASMSHELRTPLAALLGYGDLLEDTPLEQSQRALLKTMQVSGGSLLHLLNDILDLSKIKSGKFEIDHVEFSLYEVLREVAQIFAVRAENKGLQFEVVKEDEDPLFQRYLIGDGKRISQILVNLISNAVKFTDHGSVRLKVSSDNASIRFTVTDSGIGMSTEVVERLFKPFEQADSTISGRFGGTGLGLHISKVLANLMEGEITVESEVGQGSAFTLTLPLQLSDRKIESEAQKKSEGQDGHRRFIGKVLVAEDAPELQVLLTRLLERYGVEVIVAANGQEAVEMALHQQMDLILMDMQMPVMDGVEATRTLRSASYRSPIVALSANVMEQHKQLFSQAGADGFLSKPIDREALQLVLARYLQIADETTVSDPAVVSPDAALKELFDKEMRLNAERLREALYADNLDVVEQIAHKLKGTASSFGYDDLGQLSKRICDAYHYELYEEMRLLSKKALIALLEITK